MAMLDKHTPIALETAEPISPFDDPECRYVAMPQAMRTFVPPMARDRRRNPDAIALLSRLTASLKAGEPTQIDLPNDRETRDFLDEILGEGEISILADQPGQRLSISEAVFAGVWRVRRYGELAQDYLETGECPAILLKWSAACGSTASLPTGFPGNLMNAPSLLHELFAKTQGYAQGSEEVINLTLLPLTPEDMAFLASCLGLAGLSILAKGYGDCRIRQTGLANLWWVQYFNSTGQLILNTLEITALPKVVMAAAEDLEDSAIRLDEVLAELAQAG